MVGHEMRQASHSGISNVLLVNDVELFKTRLW